MQRSIDRSGRFLFWWRIHDMGRDIVEAIPNDDGIEIDQTLSLSLDSI